MDGSRGEALYLQPLLRCFFSLSILTPLSSLQCFTVLSMIYKASDFFFLIFVPCTWCYLEMSRAKNELQRTPTFMDLYQEMEAMFVKQAAGMSHTLAMCVWVI